MVALKANLRTFLCWLSIHHGVRTADGLRRKHMHAYQTHLSAYRTAAGTPLKPGSINNRVKAVRSFAAFLKDRGYLAADLKEELLYVKEPEMLPTNVLEHARIRKLLRAIDTTGPAGCRDRTILELLYSTGIRAGELIGLTLDALDLRNATLRVRGKGNKERMVPVGATALRYLESYIKAIRPFGPGSRTTGALFLNRLGKPLKWQSLNRIVHKHCAAIDPRITAHTFRRSCTTELVRNNANLYHVKDLLGHESMDTLRPYTKLTILDLKKTHAKCHPREKDEKRRRG